MKPQNMHPDTLTIIVNGQERAIPASSTIADFLHSCNVPAARVVVQLNGEIIPRDEYARTSLHAESRMEIVTLVGGG